MDLFASLSSSVLLPIPVVDGELAMLSQLPLSVSNADVMAQLIADTPWRTEIVTVYGKQHPQPRLSAAYGAARYTYSGLTIEPLPWTPLLLLIKAAVESTTGIAFNSVLLNYYRNERDGMGMHSDDERELGRNPAVASVSFGATRTFILRHKTSKHTIKLDLTDGCLLLMAGALQHHWQHGINKLTRPLGARINLTFRSINLQDGNGRQK
ncbi:MAG: alpha-ketoglutarate-dependent dioxygenase AlkB [Pseudomonadota bacterium]|nr:alpha-ketoglutarate-dependent dioxygenase AlkB [Pseudomonadota bacterium]